MTEKGASQQMGAFRMGESGKVEAWAEGQVEAKSNETKTCYKSNGQGHLANVCPSESAGEAEPACKRTTPAQTKAHLRALSQELTEADMRLFSGEWDDDARGVRTDGRRSFNKFRQRAEELGIGGTMMSLTKFQLEHDGIEVCHESV